MAYDTRQQAQQFFAIMAMHVCLINEQVDLLALFLDEAYERGRRDGVTQLTRELGLESPEKAA